MFKRITIFFVILWVILWGVIRNPVPVFSHHSLETSASPYNLKKYVEELVGMNPYRKYSNLDSLNQAADYIKSEFDKYCPEVKLQEYVVENQRYKNIICFFPGESKKRVIIGAHYDVCSDQDGADDNASGVSGIIELTRLIKENKIIPKFDTEIVAYTLEEPPYFRSEYMGSYIHAKSLFEKNVDVKFMLSVEMIGYYDDSYWSQEYPSPILYGFYPLSGNFIALIGGIKEYLQVRELKSSLNSYMDMDVFSLNAPDFIPGIDF